MIQSETFDVVIVGSGAAGGTLAAHLARQGVDVAVVEGGPKVNTRTDFNTHAMPFEFPNRHIPTMRPGMPGFDSERSRGVGGKTMLWNAVAWRFSQRDFKGSSIEGAGEDWPIDYSDLAPYYDRIEREVGVCGNRDGLEDLPDGIFLPPVPMKCSDRIVKRGAAEARRQSRSTCASRRCRCAMASAPGLPLLRQLHGGLRRGRQVQLGRRPHRFPALSRPASSKSSPTRIVREVTGLGG